MKFTFVFLAFLEVASAQSEIPPTRVVEALSRWQSERSAILSGADGLVRSLAIDPGLRTRAIGLLGLPVASVNHYALDFDHDEKLTVCDWALAQRLLWTSKLHAGLAHLKSLAPSFVQEAEGRYQVGLPQLLLTARSLEKSPIRRTGP